jgi:hypothetical protein
LIARIVRATASCELDALALSARWDEEVRPLEEAAPGYRGGILLREGTDILAVSCWDDANAIGGLEQVLGHVTGSTLASLIAKPISCQFKAL